MIPVVIFFRQNTIKEDAGIPDFNISQYGIPDFFSLFQTPSILISFRIQEKNRIPDLHNLTS